MDRPVFGLVNRAFTVERDENGWLSTTTRRELASRILEGLDAPSPHQGKRLPLRQVIGVQARAVAGFVRGQHPAYSPFRLIL